MGEGAWIVDAASVAASVSRVPWRNLRVRVREWEREQRGIHEFV